MPTLTIRNVRATVVWSLKALARRRGHSIGQKVRELIETCISERRSVLDQIEAGWRRQTCRPAPGEVDAWIAAGRS